MTNEEYLENLKAEVRSIATLTNELIDISNRLFARVSKLQLSQKRILEEVKSVSQA